jgi:Uma2 family endonuclease
MPEILEQVRTRRAAHLENANGYTSTIYDGVYYPEQREDDMGETSYHIKLIADFLTILKHFFKDRRDVFLSANMNLYYEKGSPQKWFAPDLLVAFGVPNVERSSYLLFREKVFPQVIFEVASGKTWSSDLDTKFRFYESFGAEEYYVFDPEFAYLPSPLMAFHRRDEKFVELEIENNRVFSPRLNLEIVQTENTFRLFNPQTNEYLRTLDEAESELERLKAEIEKLKSQK